MEDLKPGSLRALIDMCQLMAETLRIPLPEAADVIERMMAVQTERRKAADDDALRRQPVDGPVQ